MPRALYFKCECGNEVRDIKPNYTEEEMFSFGYDRNSRGNYVYFYDPNRKKEKAKIDKITCTKCNVEVEASRDPKAVGTMILSNFMDLSD